MKTAIQQLIEFINKMQNDGSGGLRVQAILDYAESLEQSHTSPMSAEQVERVTGHDLITGALPYIEESLNRTYIDRLAKYLDSYLDKVFNQLPVSIPNQIICDCVIPKPIDAYHPIDKNICRDCNGKINADDEPTTPSVKADGWVSVEDELPKVGQKVDLWLVPDDEEKSYRMTWTWEKESTARITINGCKVTHWQPFTPPKQHLQTITSK